MSCKPENDKQGGGGGGCGVCTGSLDKPPKPEEVTGGSLFSWLFGGSSSSSPEDSTGGKCEGCGMDKCNCNCALRDHLKSCCNYGNLPPLITKDSCPVPKKPDPCDPCVKKPDDACKKECVFLPVDTSCKPKEEEKKPAFACDTQKVKKEEKCCMPSTDTTGCVPSWICPPASSGVRTYSAPDGATILPIYSGCSSKPTKCGECGTVTKEEEKAKPNVDPSCPMVRARDCGSKNQDKDKDKDNDKKSEGGFFSNITSKITALFSGDKKK